MLRRRMEQAAEELPAACFGLTCPKRGACWRYLVVDLAPGASTERATCLRNGEYADFLPVPAGAIRCA